MTLSPSPSPARLLWDKGGLWSLMNLEAAWQRGLALSPISAADIAKGGLEDARLLVVPGGWSIHKKKALGDSGAGAIREFIERGGIYLGFCGGAGLALDVPDGLGLVPLGRATGQGRVPGLSGPVLVEPDQGARRHFLWSGADNPAHCLVWFPGQFAEPDDPSLRVIARYYGPSDGLYVADLRLEQIAATERPALEEQYGVGLDPSPLWGQPAMLEASLGMGRLLLSYLHLDTPGDGPCGAAMERLWQGLLSDGARRQAPAPPGPRLPRMARLAGSCAALWDRGRALGLWQHRHPAMPLWTRGARGLEFWELKRLSEAMAAWCDDDDLAIEIEAALEPVLAHAEAVLHCQKSRLEGNRPEGHAVEIEAVWFPRPRRVGGDWAEAVEKLAAGLLGALQTASPH